MICCGESLVARELNWVSTELIRQRLYARRSRFATGTLLLRRRLFLCLAPNGSKSGSMNHSAR